MRKVAFIVASASLFALAPLSARFGVVLSSVLLVWLGVLLAVMATFAVSSLAVTAGALGAFASGVVSSTSPVAAGAVLMVFVFAERTTRVREPTARAVHVLLALVGGAICGALTDAFTSSPTLIAGVALLVGATLTALPLLVPADDAVAHALSIAAASVTGDARALLGEGANLRRRSKDLPLDEAAAARVATTWKSLLRLAEVRVRLARTRPLLLGAHGAHLDAVAEVERTPCIEDEPKAAPTEPDPSLTNATVTDVVDTRIREHVRALARAYAAVDTADAAALGLDDVAQKSVESMNESLDEVSRAMVEVRADGATTT